LMESDWLRKKIVKVEEMWIMLQNLCVEGTVGLGGI
jgi:hypothetical protein